MLRALLVLVALAAAAPAHAQMTGGWTGTGLQVDRGGVQSSWTISMRVRADDWARIEYPSLSCKAKLYETRRTGAEIEYREEITEGNCITGGRLVVKLMDGRLWWYWHDAQGRADASAVLYRDNEAIS
jgi:hypothetical protein